MLNPKEIQTVKSKGLFVFELPPEIILLDIDSSYEDLYREIGRAVMRQHPEALMTRSLDGNTHVFLKRNCGKTTHTVEVDCNHDRITKWLSEYCVGWKLL